MGDKEKKKDDITVYIQDQEYIANKYVMRCFSVTMLIYLITFLLNIVGVFVVEQKLMWSGFIPSIFIYLFVLLIIHKLTFSNKKLKYFILFATVLVFTIMGVTITYHVVLVSILPFLYATLYSSKRIMSYVYLLTVFSTIIIVYGGYFYGLCDANMAVLTSCSLQAHMKDGQFVLTQVNPNPMVTLMLYYVIPRCLIYITVAAVCSSLVEIVRGSIEKAKLTAALEKAKEDAERAKEDAERANEAKSQFLARMSHEIRTPINAVLGMNEMILRESEETQIQKYAYDVKDSSLVLLNLINEILDASKIESGMMELVNVNYEIASLLNDLYNMISIKAKEKNLRLIFDVDSSIPQEYYGDDKRIRQILLNLLTNAVKYTEHGTVEMKVSCRIDNENAILRYSVKDTGIGIREEDIGKLYDAFQRLDMTKNRNVEGTGLGMNITQQLLKLMGSELQIYSEYGKGTEFVFEVEQKIVNQNPLGNMKERLIKKDKDVSKGIDWSASDAKILVVDDFKMNLKVFSNLLRDTKMQIYEAESGKECIELVKQKEFDLVFLDHMMPEMDGIETLHEIKKNHLCDGVPIIMLTANAIVGDKEKYMDEGFDDFLSKPIIPNELAEIVLRHLPEQLICKSGN